MNNNPPVYECVLTANEQETSLLLTSATKEFCNLINIPPDSFGRPLEELNLNQTTTWIYQAFSYLKEGNECIKDLREVNKNFWSYSLSYNRPILTIEMNPIWNVGDLEHTYNLNNIVNLPLNRFLGCFYDSIMLSFNENSYYIESISKRLSQLTGLKAGDPITSLLSSMRCISTDILLRQSLDQNKVFYFLDVFTHHSKLYYMLISLMPLNHSQRHMIVAIHLLEEKDYYQMMKSVNKNPTPVCNSGEIGVAVFQTSDGNYKKLINANHCFNRLVYSHEDSNFLHTKVIPLCCAQQNITTFSRRLGNLDCIITAIPTLTANQLFMFIIPDSGTKQSMQILADRLTKREFEIACHVFNGNSIRGIAIDCGITEGTVKKNLSNIYNKLQVSNRVELVRLIFSCNN